jgi:CHAD domain-containing protein
VTVEREVKLGVWPGFSLPDLSDLAEDIRIEHAAELRLEATYHDTADLRLARWGITLRHRTGEGDGEDGWTLKLPKSGTGSVLVRDEIVVDGGPKVVPDRVVDHVAAWIRSAELQPVARMQTVRRTTRVLGPDGKALAEVVDDEVSVLDGRHVALRFREVEVELGDDADESLIDELVARLRAAGAGAPDPTPKVVRALGPRALSPPELVVPEIAKDATAADVLRGGIASAVLRVLEHDAPVRLSDEPEAVHQARVGTRRLRSDLRTFGPLLDDGWVERLRTELAWYADLLGAVRDADVLLARLTADIATLDERDARPGAALVERLRGQRREARAALLAGMRTDRYRALLDSLVDAAVDPRVLADGAAPARDVLPTLASRPWRALAKSVRRAGREPEDAVLHGIRIRAKRARYAADVAALVVGKPATRFAGAVAAVQDVLGAHQDACVRRAWLRAAALAASPDSALVAGQLIAMADADADARRADWHKAWKTANEGRLRAWLTH